MELVFYQFFGHYISQLVDCIDLMDIDFTLGIAFSFYMFTEEVKLDRKDLLWGVIQGSVATGRAPLLSSMIQTWQ